MTAALRRLVGLELVMVITEVQPSARTNGDGLWRATRGHYEWLRVRPWWAVWRRVAP